LSKVSDAKFQRNDSANSASQLNQLNSAAQLSQQQPINLIPNLNNFPFFFPSKKKTNISTIFPIYITQLLNSDYAYPNLYMPMPNGGQQATNQQQFQQQQQQQQQQNKPSYNFPNSTGVYDVDQGVKDYSNYNSQQSQLKTSSEFQLLVEIIIFKTSFGTRSNSV
jgi:hypothetical protein